MPLKKSELYSSLWKSCDELRGGMDASQYKDYVLVLLFVKYVSDKYAGQRDALIEVPEGGSFEDMKGLVGDKEIGERMNKIIARLAEANDLQGVIDVADFNDPEKLGRGKEMVDKLSKLVAIFSKPSLDFSANRADGDDLLGDAYEYLMRHFATESGKSKGQFYTPAEVSRVMAKVIGVGHATSSSQTIHDPTCGSGSLLVKAHDEAKSRTGLDLTLYGQEMDNATAALARMNMILHDCPTATVWKHNTLANPHFTAPDGSLKTFDFIVANPPFSAKAWSNGVNTANDPHRRFELGVPPEKNGDYAFLLHILTALKSTGKAAVILPHGVLFRGNVEGTIRRELVRRGYIKAIIGLPANLFYGTGIPACIVVLDKEHAGARTGIFMIDASREFRKDGNKNRLREQDIHRIVDTFTRALDVPGYSRMVPTAEIADARNDYNLNLPRYIDASEPEDLQDIDGHLRGGIPERDIAALERYWTVLPSVRELLFESAGRPGYCALRVPMAEVKATILGHAEFAAFERSILDLFAAWRAMHEPTLRAIDESVRPKELVAGLAESLLETFRPARIVNPYDVYQHLMDFWSETMQDDVYLVEESGWIVAARPRPVAEKEPHEFSVGKQKLKSDLIPLPILVARYFADEQAAVDECEAALAVADARLEELAEEHGGDDGFLTSVAHDKGKVTKKLLGARLREIGRSAEYADERAVLDAYAEAMEAQAGARDRLKRAEAELESKVAVKYGELSEEEIKTLVVEDKWLARLESDVRAEIDRVSQSLAARVRTVAERYATPLPQLVAQVDELSARVEEHLRRMGAVWN